MIQKANKYIIVYVEMSVKSQMKAMTRHFIDIFLRGLRRRLRLMFPVNQKTSRKLITEALNISGASSATK
jgi:hypothetical protein